MIGGEDPKFADYAPLGSTGELIWYAMQLAAHKAKGPGHDIVGTLIDTDADGQLTEAEFGMFVVTLTVAGNETTRNSITQGMVAFTDCPDQWELFKAQRPKTAADEIIRWASVGERRGGRVRRPVHLRHPAKPQPTPRVRRPRHHLHPGLQRRLSGA